MTKPSDNERRKTHRIGKVLPGYFGDVFSEEILQSPSFNNLCTYTLPSKLIEIVMRQQPGMLNSDQLAIEKQYEQFPEAVVFVKGVPKASKLIQNFDNQIDEDNFVKEFGRQAYDAALKVLNDDVKKIDQIGKAYCGWLVQQRSYQDDIAELRAMLEERSDETASRCSKSICEKWRLMALVTTEIPEPLMPHLSAINLYAKDAPPGSVVPFVPDTFPIFGTGQMAERLSDAQIDSGASHLSAWLELTSKASVNSRPFKSLARQYPLQHYWRVLRSRYPKETHRKQQVFSHVFAEYFDVSQDSIRRDFQSLRRTSGLLDAPMELRF